MSASPPILLSDCWAKTDPTTGKPALTVRDHCLIVGAVAEVLWHNLPSAVRSQLPSGGVALAALHDIGKITPGFLAKCDWWKARMKEVGLPIERLQNGCRKHADLSQTDMETRLGEARIWARALGGHHGRFVRCPETERNESKSIFLPLRDKLAEELVALFGALPAENPAIHSQLSEYPRVAALCGFIILCDWIGSDEENFPLPAGGLESPPLSKSDALASAAVALQRRSIVQPPLRTDRTFGQLFTPAASPAYAPNDLQQKCRDHITGPGLYIVEAPMGVGKTEAALNAAIPLVGKDKAAGIYFALPTQLTSNKIHERVATALSQAIPDETVATLALAHSASWLTDPTAFRVMPPTANTEPEERTDPRAVRSWFTSRRALLARYGVGTIDQALIGALPVKYAALRIFGLAAKVVIFDEVHTYDGYTARLLDALIRHLLALRCTVIILSATLTVARRGELVACASPTVPDLPDSYPLLTCCPDGKAPYPVEIDPPEDSIPLNISIRKIALPDPSLPDSLVEEIQARTQRGECVLVIRNTVALAQETYSRLLRDGIESGLLHSRYPSHVRNGHPLPEFTDEAHPGGREASWIAKLGKTGPRPKGCILVATQIAEQSLDIDADLLVTDLCPADMLLQRIGRLWRHMTLRPRETRPCPEPETWVLVPETPPDEDADGIERALKPHSAIYAPYILLRTLQQLRDTLPVPAAIRTFLEGTYVPVDADAEPPAWVELRRRMDREIEKLTDQGRLIAADPYLTPLGDDAFRAPTRLRDFPTTDLVILKAVPAVQPGGELELHFHSGEKLRWHPARPWTFQIARAVFLSTVRVPSYQVPDSTPPEWLKTHSHGPVIAAHLNGRNLIETEIREALPFVFQSELGLVYEKNLTEPPGSKPSFQPYDDDWPL
jgi:CRISPR-associated endonuclease/helicase Cas3